MEAKDMEEVKLIELSIREMSVGNLYYYDGDDVVKWSMDDFRAMEFDRVDCAVQPIPLTEEWLVKFGFKKQKRSEWFSKKGFVVRIFNNTLPVKIQGKHLVTLGYVHQLQNLYYALTGKELTIKN